MAESTSEKAEPKTEKKAEKAAPEYPDTPSGKALQKVGNLDGETLDDPADGAEQGEAYQAEKKKHRWG